MFLSKLINSVLDVLKKTAKLWMLVSASGMVSAVQRSSQPHGINSVLNQYSFPNNISTPFNLGEFKIAGPGM